MLRHDTRQKVGPATLFPQSAATYNPQHVSGGCYIRPGGCADGETTLAHGVVPALRAGMLCLADRYFFGHALWRAAAATGADLLWRVRSNLRLPRATVLGDGSYLSVVYPSEKDRRHATNGVRVRVVEYRLQGVADAEPLYRLVTTILDPAQAPAADLAALYHERWEIEGALAELKTQLRGAQVVLRSKTPDLVRQEFWGLLLAHFAVRGLMHEAALRADEDPDRLSFLHAVRVVRRKLPLLAAFPPRHRPALHDEVLDEILEERAASSRGRQVPRGGQAQDERLPIAPSHPTADHAHRLQGRYPDRKVNSVALNRQFSLNSKR